MNHDMLVELWWFMHGRLWSDLKILADVLLFLIINGIYTRPCLWTMYAVVSCDFQCWMGISVKCCDELYSVGSGLFYLLSFYCCCTYYTQGIINLQFLFLFRCLEQKRLHKRKDKGMLKARLDTHWTSERGIKSFLLPTNRRKSFDLMSCLTGMCWGNLG